MGLFCIVTVKTTKVIQNANDQSSVPRNLRLTEQEEKHEGENRASEAAVVVTGKKSGPLRTSKLRKGKLTYKTTAREIQQVQYQVKQKENHTAS